MRIRILFGLGLAVSLDAGAGIGITHLAAGLVGRQLSLIEYLAGVFIALSPDLDVVFQRLEKGKVTGEHKWGSPTHYPLAMIGLYMLIWWLLSSFWAATAVLLLLFHYVEDSIVAGSGIVWLWPWSRQSYAFLRGPDSRLGYDRFRLVTPVTQTELRWDSSDDLVTWVERDFLGLPPKPKACLGVAVLVVALVIATTSWLKYMRIW